MKTQENKPRKKKTSSIPPQETVEEKIITPQMDTQSSTKPTIYVVVRDGYRVSDKEYLSNTDPEALSEKEFWEKVELQSKFPRPVEIVQYDAKRHRVW